MSIEDLKKKNQKNNESKTSKKQRRKKLSKFKDTMHHNFGSPKFGGVGEGKPNICSICGKPNYKITSIYDIKQKKIINYCTDCINTKEV